MLGGGRVLVRITMQWGEGYGVNGEMEGGQDGYQRIRWIDLSNDKEEERCVGGEWKRNW